MGINIEEVKEGENLWAKNVETGEESWKPVTKVWIEPNRGIYEISVINADGFVQKIEATDDHPFYVVGKGWRDTIELVKGDKIETKETGSVKVVSIKDEQRTDVTYNFTIEDFHTYYVTKQNLLVHNCGENYLNKANKKVSSAKKGDTSEYERLSPQPSSSSNETWHRSKNKKFKR